jgi:molybdopterin synthase sulfur carrier subunit
MAKVFFTSNLRRHVDCPAMDAKGNTVREVLNEVFAAQDRLGHYVVDDQGALRKHMTVFIDGRQVRDRRGLSDAVGKDSDIHVIQALSGG